MKAMVITNFGNPEVFTEAEVDKPTPKNNEVLVKVYATSVNPADCGMRQGIFGPRVKLPAILGFDVSGVVEAVGENVKDFQVGDEVYYAIAHDEGGGANAEYHIANESTIAKKPTNISHLEAASVPVAGGTAWAALITRADIKVGETVLIHGGAGGVGTFAIQIAKAAGAYVYTTCGGYDADFVKSIGADRAIDYRNEDFINIIMQETNGKGVDVTFTTVGGEILAKSLVVTKAEGRAVTVTGVAGDFNIAIFKNITVHFAHLDQTRPKLDALRTLIERGQIKPVIGKTFGLHQLAQAHQTLEEGGESIRGKVVVQVV
ncbi:zinc-dependent alcohol dehydrogenase family protein [Nostoc sp. UCD121]|uniref:zinc-dependent alcohol dehydrogenase family protein n=1 Tax=unclassified Nostoc TaxID=2593658 RepID=UPI0016246EF7|nr:MULTISPECIES: zinc-dependent alcohol dehydrogenase family protein [unclassified Nostoc]MBC1221936.1 zinc-dependent alcohol dehydrogenase family protein [Nostoc sp. UCD120]MBC1277621.1 zinc-dependent alcohol dehydrogenase family protein [Nostoc sp. UCD121]MBC1296345.1 zinc-dependent alcohol dehydrogenase family protein [Nostoc sp. UCD122]